MKWTILSCCLACAAGACWTSISAQDDAQEASTSQLNVSVEQKSETASKSQPSHWMRKKMRLSQEAFEGIAKGDFDQIRESAREMKVLSRAEHFVRSKPENYRIQLKLFRFANDELMRSSNEKNIDAVTLAFNQLTVSCVNCHKVIRGNL